MLKRIFPVQFDNQYLGNRFALVIFVLIIFLHAVMSLGAIFRADGGAQSADGIPLDTFTPAGAQAVIGVGALLGIASLLLCTLFLIALIRYRSMIPLMYLMVVTQWLARKGAMLIKPIPRMAATSTGFYVSLGIFAVSLIGLILSVTGKRYSQAQESPAA